MVFYQGAFATVRRQHRLEARLGAEEASMYRLGGAPTPRAQRSILRHIGCTEARFVPAMVLNQSGRVRATLDTYSGPRNAACWQEHQAIGSIGFIDTTSERDALFDALLAASVCFQVNPPPENDPYAGRLWEMAHQEPDRLDAARQVPRPPQGIAPKISVAAWQAASLDGYPLRTALLYSQSGDVYWTTRDTEGRPVTGGSVHVTVFGGSHWDLESFAARGIVDAFEYLRGETEAFGGSWQIEHWMKIYQQMETGPFYLVDDREKARTVWRWEASVERFVKVERRCDDCPCQ